MSLQHFSHQPRWADTQELRHGAFFLFISWRWRWRRCCCLCSTLFCLFWSSHILTDNIKVMRNLWKKINGDNRRCVRVLGTCKIDVAIDNFSVSFAYRWYVVFFSDFALVLYRYFFFALCPLLLLPLHVIVCGSLFVHNRCCHNFCWFSDKFLPEKNERQQHKRGMLCYVVFRNSSVSLRNSQRQSNKFRFVKVL